MIQNQLLKTFLNYCYLFFFLCPSLRTLAKTSSIFFGFFFLPNSSLFSLVIVVSTVKPLPPPTLAPECVKDSDCRQDQVCRANQCQNPCSECGVNAECKVVFHRAVCSCLKGYEGNPKVQCTKGKSKKTLLGRNLKPLMRGVVIIFELPQFLLYLLKLCIFSISFFPPLNCENNFIFVPFMVLWYLRTCQNAVPL